MYAGGSVIRKILSIVSILLISLILSLFSLVLPNHVCSGYTPPFSGWHWQNPLPQGNRLFGLSVLDQDTVWMAGGSGTILKTTDGGETWDNQNTGVTVYLRGMSATDQNTAWAVGDMGTILRTTDGGNTWETQTSGTIGNLFGVSAIDQNTAWSVGDNGLILKTTDGGASWDTQHADMGGFFTGISAFDRNTAWITSYEGVILHTVDGGNNWMTQFPVIPNVLHAVTAVDRNTAWAVGYNGTILKTIDGGANWNAQNSGTTAFLNGVCAVDQDTAWAVGDDQTILNTLDGGSSWNEQTSPDSGNSLFAIAALDKENAWIVGKSGVIYRTTDGGATWSPKYSGTTSVLFGVDAISGNVAWAVGEGGTILHTTDGGENWVQQASNTTAHFSDVSAVDQDVAWVVGSEGTILRTTDGGETWDVKNSEDTHYLTSIAAVDPNVAWAVGASGTIIKTTDGGSTWNAQESGVPHNLISISAAATHLAYAVGSEGTILKTHDGGSTWHNLNSGTDSDLMSISAVNEDIAWVAGSEGTIIKTTDGHTWEPQTSRTEENLLGISAVDKNTVYAVGRMGVILKTINGGETWNNEYTDVIDELHDVEMVDQNTAWVAGDHGALQKTPDSEGNGKVWYLAEGYTGDDNYTGERFDTYVLVQNPSGNTARILATFMLPGGDTVQREFDVVPYGRLTIHLDDIEGLENTAVSTKIESTNGVYIACERSMYFAYYGIKGGHDSIGTNYPSTTWYMSEGYTGDGNYTGERFDTYVLIQNPSETSAQIRATYMLPGGRTIEDSLTVRSNERYTIHLDEVAGLENTSVSTMIESENDVPVVCEKSMYFDYYGLEGGHDTIGANSPALNWYMPEGYTGNDNYYPGEHFDTYVLVQNPSEEDAEIRATYMLQGGEPIEKEYTVRPQERYTISLDEVKELKNAQVSTEIAATNGVPVVCERSMYFDYYGREGGHNSIGTTYSSLTWYMAEGYTGQNNYPGESFDTYILIQNPTDQGTLVRVSLLFPDRGVITFTSRIGAHERYTVHLDEIPGCSNDSVSTMVESLEGIPVNCERSMYFNFYGIDGGHDSIGYTL